MKDPIVTNGSGNFLKTDGGKTKTNAIEVPSISLPKGGGAIKGIDEKFSVNSVNGTASFSIPLPFSPARGAAPSLSLSYNSGAGNDVFGLGWSIGLGTIKRKTNKGIPQYIDDIESDTFILAGAEDLVPEFKKENDGSFSIDFNGDYMINEKDSPDGLFIIRYFKPRIEGLFARIERWTEKTNGLIKWRLISKENYITLIGWTANSVIADPGDPGKIFEWLPEFAFDDKGNCCQYIYKKEDDAGFDSLLIHNKNRLENGKLTYTNQYLERILYGNKTPYKRSGDPFPFQNDYFFQTVFDYGEYDLNAPFAIIRDWDFRLDAHSDYKAGFEIRTTRLCKRVLLFHFFDELPDGFALVSSVDFQYHSTSDHDFAFLKYITSKGYIKKSDGKYSSKSLPPIEFDYQKHEWNQDIKTISTEDLVNAPSGLDEQFYRFTDLFNEGLSGILSEQANGWYYKRNLGNGSFERARLVSPKPNLTGLGVQLQLTDLDADGGRQLVSLETESKGFFELNDDDEWRRFSNFKNIPNIDFEDANTRMLDLNGDGKPDLLISEENIFTWYPSEGRNGYRRSHKTPKTFDEEKGPAILFADEKQTIFLADMSGDGMTDIVRIRNGEVCYWPNLGYGNFGSKVTMDNAPLFDSPDSFNPSYLRLTDIDGSGTTDIIYLGKNKFSCWLNFSGNSFNTTPFEIDAFPDVHNRAVITVTDLLGNGVSCIVWSSSLLNDTQSPLRYIDLMNSRKPHLLIFSKNNSGKEVSLEYTSSTKFYIEDKLAGNPWITKLHFPVHCISRTETVDRITGSRFVSSYKYHHGYYDHPEQEFRGFGMVETTDAESFENWTKSGATNITEKNLHQEPVISKTWFHTGAFLRSGIILNQFARDYWYEELTRQGFQVVNNEKSLPDARIVAANGIPDNLIDHLSVEEWKEAIRACKGMTLRSEVFAHDAPVTGATSDQILKQLTPYSVVTNNCIIELLQPKGSNRYAVFAVKQSEAITYSYERKTDDPRIAHSLNIKFDEFANVLESASVVYQRVLADTTLPLATREEQTKTAVIYLKNQFTNDVLNDDVHRLRLPSEVKTFELKGVSKTGSYYAVGDFENILTVSNEVPYHQIDADPAAGTSQKRLFEHVRTNYLRNDLSGSLPLNQLQSLALPYENYRLAYTPALLTDIFSPVGVPDNNLLTAEGKFTHSIDENGNEDANWWIRSGTMQFTEGAETPSDARNRFFLPVSYTDPFGSKTSIKYYEDYNLFIKETENALGNRTSADSFNFRTLSPQRIRDINNNLSEVVTDELGLVKAMAIFGKGNEADDLEGLTEFTEQAEQDLINQFFNVPDTPEGVTDSQAMSENAKLLLKHATVRFIYDFDVFRQSGKPAVVASIVREEHFQKNNNSDVQLSFEYSGGLGEVIMKKIQAEPGSAKRVVINPDATYTITDTDTSALNPSQHRWIGNGRTIFNNKGNPVRQYEPYFSVSNRFEELKELVETGVTPVMYYDAINRLIRTEMPDDTVMRTEFDSWKQVIYDPNDTILESQWHNKRTNHLMDAELLSEDKDPVLEKSAADKTARHAGTPTVLHFDTLGRPVLSIEHNKNIITDADEFLRTKIKLDIEGNLRSVTDAREIPENNSLGNLVMQYKYDMLGNNVYQNSMDAGQRWHLFNILGSPLRSRDERNHEFQYFYDVAHRPLKSVVTGGESSLNNIFNRIIYGETLLLPDRSNETSLQAVNLLGKPIRHFDTGGVILTPEYDFKGQPKFSTRKLFKDYKSSADWTDANMISDLENEEFTFTAETDALGRITSQTAPDGSNTTPSYNKAGLLNSEMVTHANPALTANYIKNIDYNEKGQRNKIIYGNDVFTNFYYDRKNYRLIRLETKRKNNDPLQDWHYTFDPAGNITHITDKNIPVVFFDNQKITGLSEFTYDALYRLREASGRENNAALNFGNLDNWNDAPFMHDINPGDPMAIRNYTQTYQYDEAGNIRQMKHVAAGNNWTRDYQYENTTNRLLTTKVGSETYTYVHHPKHGYIMEMPQLQEMGWNFKEELVKSVRQKVNPGNGTAETTYYQYDGQGQRIRKITENSAAAGSTPEKKDERIYLGGYETYRTYASNDIDFERETLSLNDQGTRFVMVETVKQNKSGAVDEPVGSRLTRYQFNNYLGSASMELDDSAQVISYEEYHPYGTSSYQAKNATLKAAAKRYRYTGMERDEETGLEYHSARYYLPWLGRWLSCDPKRLIDGFNLFCYVKSNPITHIDLKGTEREKMSLAQMERRLKEINKEIAKNEAIIAVSDANIAKAKEDRDKLLAEKAVKDKELLAAKADLKDKTEKARIATQRAKEAAIKAEESAKSARRWKIIAYIAGAVAVVASAGFLAYPYLVGASGTAAVGTTATTTAATTTTTGSVLTSSIATAAPRVAQVVGTGGGAATVVNELQQMAPVVTARAQVLADAVEKLRALLPQGMTIQQWGIQVWGNGREGALNLFNRTREQLLQIPGLNIQSATAWRDHFLSLEAGQGGVAPGYRVELLNHIIKILGG